MKAGVSAEVPSTLAVDDERAFQLTLTARPLRDDEQASSVDAAIALAHRVNGALRKPAPSAPKRSSQAPRGCSFQDVARERRSVAALAKAA